MRELSTASERLLYRVMAGLSEDYFCAGWLSGCEHALWADLTGEETCGAKGWGISSDEKAELQLAHTIAGGWILWSEEAGGPAFVATEEWLTILSTQRDKPSEAC